MNFKNIISIVSILAINACASEGGMIMPDSNNPTSDAPMMVVDVADSGSTDSDANVQDSGNTDQDSGSTDTADSNVADSGNTDSDAGSTDSSDAAVQDSGSTDQDSGNTDSDANVQDSGVDQDSNVAVDSGNTDSDASVPVCNDPTEPGYVWCATEFGGTCVAPSTFNSDPDNCGHCGNVCPNDPSGMGLTRTCNHGMCQYIP